MKIRVFVGGVVFALGLSSSTAYALLIDNESYTTDTTTGLDWLDLTLTRGLSFDEVAQQLSSGGTYEGWRHANRSEIAAFWSSAGGEGPFDGAASGEANWIGRLQNYWGKTYPYTYTVGSNGPAPYSAQTTIAMTGEVSPSCPDCMRTVYLLDNVNVSDSNIGDLAQLEQLNEAYRWQGQVPIGHALVRRTMQVAEPSSLMLVSLVFGVVCVGRFKRAI